MGRVAPAVPPLVLLLALLTLLGAMPVMPVVPLGSAFCCGRLTRRPPLDQLMQLPGLRLLLCLALPPALALALLLLSRCRSTGLSAGL